jgi:hypothetical protein
MYSLTRIAAASALVVLASANPVAHGQWQSWSASYTTKPSMTASAPSMSSTTTVASTPSCQGYFEPLAAPYLNDLAVAAGKLWFGSATDQPGTGEDTNILYQEILNDTHIFGGITPANGMKFVSTEPEQGVFNYTVSSPARSVVCSKTTSPKVSFVNPTPC